MGNSAGDIQVNRPRSVAGGFRRRLGVAIARVSWVYLIAAIGLWAVVRFAGDRWWAATLLLFGPLWGAAVALAILLPAALLFCRRALLPLAATSAVLGFGVLGVCFPWRTWIHRSHGGPRLRVFTCNVHDDFVNYTDLRNLLEEAQPDIVILQEAGHFRWNAPPGDENWNWRRNRELFIASRYPIVNTIDYTKASWYEWGGVAVRYDIAAPGGTLHLFNLHLASPHMPFADVIDNKPHGVDRLRRHLDVRAEQSAQLSALAHGAGDNVILGGDFNTLCQGSIYQHNWSSFSDAFTAAGLGIGHTYFGEGAAVRIDHILSGPAWQFRHCWVGPDVGSPHRPVIADLECTTRK